MVVLFGVFRDVVFERVADLADNRLPCLVETGVGQRLTQTVRPLLDRLELAQVVAHPVVGEFGQRRLLNRDDRNLEVGRLIAALGRGLELEFITSGYTDELLVEII